MDVSVGGEDCIDRGDNKDNGFISISLDEPSQPQPSAVIEDGTTDNQQHDMITLDTKQLAINAGTVGQLLMMKRLSKESIPNEDDISTLQSPTVSKGGGFGKQQVKQSRKKKRNR